MRKVIIAIMVCCIFCYAKAQMKAEYKIIKQDTINIIGIVYDASGLPLSDVIVTSKGIDYKNSRQLGTVTDSMGKFKLNGALLNDTIEIRTFNNYKSIINNSSRYLEINMPLKHDQTLGHTQIIAQRKFKKSSAPTFKLFPTVVCFDCGWGQGIRYPYPIGGEHKFIEFVKSLITYPEKAIKNNIEGKVEIGFTLDIDGMLKNFKVLRGIGYGCEEQVILALKSSPKWNPGIYNGKPVGEISSITINFKLTDK